MIKKTFERVDESIYTEKLDNGIEVYHIKQIKQRISICQYQLNMAQVLLNIK